MTVSFFPHPLWDFITKRKEDVKPESSPAFYWLHDDAAAREVDPDTFFHTRESGGTRISSAYELCLKLVRESFPPADYNIYPFHFTDGDNFSDDDERARQLLAGIVPVANVFCYGQVEGGYGSGSFLKLLQERIKNEEKVLTATIQSRDNIYDALKAFLGTGH